jgi:hypothetical protein
VAGRPKTRAKREAERVANLPMVIPQPEPEPQRGDYRPEFVEIARKLCEAGATNQELGDEFGVTKRTIINWQQRHPEFAEALKLGKQIADDRMERTAYELSVGYTTTVVETIKLRDERGNERTVQVEKQVEIPPNDKMLWYMLKNRMPDKYRDKTESVVHHEHHISVDEARERLKRRLEEIKQKQLPSG